MALALDKDTEKEESANGFNESQGAKIADMKLIYEALSSSAARQNVENSVAEDSTAEGNDRYHKKPEE